MGEPTPLGVVGGGCEVSGYHSGMDGGQGDDGEGSAFHIPSSGIY